VRRDWEGQKLGIEKEICGKKERNTILKIGGKERGFDILVTVNNWWSHPDLSVGSVGYLSPSSVPL